MNIIGISVALMFLLMAGGVWIAAALGLAAGVGLTQFLSFDRMVSIVGKMAWQEGTRFIVIALPLFILMGEVLLQCGVMKRIYAATSKLVSAVPGGLLQTNIATGTIFAACSGSSLASAATIGSSGYPVIKSRGYEKRLSLGSIAAGGTLGILIPPSIIFIIYGSLAEVSIGQLFLAGLFPGLLLAFAYSAYIGLRALLNPNLAQKEKMANFREFFSALLELWQIWVLIFVIMGGIYGGIASPTEVAGLAAFLTVIFAAFTGELTFERMKKACLNTVRQTSMIVLVIAMAKVLSLILIYAQVPAKSVEWVSSTGLTPLTLVFMMIALYLVMGMFFDGISMMVITIPFIAPTMTSVGIDLVWLGVLIVLTIEIGLLTPPVGLNLYILQGATGEPFWDIVLGSLPFVVVQMIVLGLVVFFPQIAMFLPAAVF